MKREFPRRRRISCLFCENGDVAGVGEDLFNAVEEAEEER